MTLLLCGTVDSIPTAVLAQHISAARAGRQRLVIVDEGSQLVGRHADHDRDRLIDPARGNWDFFADHIGELEIASGGEAILCSDDAPERVLNAASCVLADILWQQADEVGAGLWDVSHDVRGLGYASLVEAMRLDLDDPDDTRVGWQTLALLQENAGRFQRRSPGLPLVSVRRWLDGDPRAVLFIAAGAEVDDGACRSVNAAIARVIGLEGGTGRSVDRLTYRLDDRPTRHGIAVQAPAPSRHQTTTKGEPLA